jgi:hypothetical protein
VSVNGHELAADELPSNGETKGGMTVRGMIKAVRDWAKRQKDAVQFGEARKLAPGKKPRFNFIKDPAERRRRIKEFERRRSAGKKSRPDFQSVRRHLPETGVRKFRVADGSPWNQL